MRVIQQQPSRADVLEMRDEPLPHVARRRRVRNDCIGRAVAVERKGVLTGADVAALNAAQAEGLQVATRAPTGEDDNDLKKDNTVSRVRLTVPVVRLCSLIGEAAGPL